MSTLRMAWADVLLAAGLAIGGGFAVWHSARHIPRPMLEDARCTDVWFDGDLAHRFQTMSNWWNTRKTTVIARHPLFWLVSYPMVKAIKLAFGLGPFASVCALSAILAACWLAGLFALCRLIGCPRLDACLFAALGAVSAGAMFWFTVPETWAFGSLTILLALLVLAASRHVAVGAGWFVSANALTFGITMTNWMVGLFSTFAEFARRRAAVIAAAGLLIVLGLSSIHWIVAPHTRTVFHPHEVMLTKASVLQEEAGGPLVITRALFLHAMVMPVIDRIPQKYGGVGWLLTVQHSRAGSASLWGAVAIACWAGLLGFGAWGAMRDRVNRRVALVLGLSLAGQLVLHLFFGEETFLYALHVIPLLVLLVAFGSLTPARRVVLALAVICLAGAAVNNTRQLGEALGMVQAYAGTLEGPPHVEPTLKPVGDAP